MNKLQIGFSKNIDECLDELRTLRDRTDTGLLYINDEVPDLPQASHFDVGSDNLNPLADIDYKHARHLAEVLYSAYPQGENTLTVRNGRRQLLKALLKYNRFDKLEGSEEVEALRDDILASPVLRRILTTTRDEFAMNPRSIILARVNRAELGDFDAFLIGQILINLYEGQIVIPDLGFYGRDANIELIRQTRLIAGVNYLGELPLRLRNAALLMTDKTGHGALYDDAETLARFAGKVKDTDGFSTHVFFAMRH